MRRRGEMLTELMTRPDLSTTAIVWPMAAGPMVLRRDGCEGEPKSSKEGRREIEGFELVGDERGGVF